MEGSFPELRFMGSDASDAIGMTTMGYIRLSMVKILMREPLLYFSLETDKNFQVIEMPGTLVYLSDLNEIEKRSLS
jgi:hypothetical protein